MGKQICITTAKAQKLNERTFGFGSKRFLAWDLKFSDHPLFTFNTPKLYISNSEEKAEKFKQALLEKLNSKDNNIPIIYANNGIIAIGIDKQWLDLTDYHIKSIEELNINKEF